MTQTRKDFDDLIRSHAHAMAAAIRRVCGHRFHSLAPDIQQEVYLALWKHLEGGKTIHHPASYLYKMALTAALATVRKLRPDVVLPEEAAGEAVAPDDTGFADLSATERKRLLGQVLDHLDPDQARALRAYLAGFNHHEVAALFGWSPSVARHRIYRGIDRLKSGFATGEPS